MPTTRYDAIVVGAGHNGLVAAAYLAKAGLRTIVLERRERAGGLLAAEVDGWTLGESLVVQDVGGLRPGVVRALRLTAHGFHPIEPAVAAYAPSAAGRGVTLWKDPARTVAALRDGGSAEGDRFAALDTKVRAVASFLAHVQAAEPPDLTSPSVADAIRALRLGRALRRLGGERQVRETLRLLPMAVADLVGEAFDDESLRGVVAARGVRYAAMGPWSAGTAMNLLWDSATGGGAAGRTVFARGGPPALAGALLAAARSCGAEVRCGADVRAITVRAGAVGGVALATGEEVAASIVASSADPKRTILGLLDPMDVGPMLAWRTEHVRTPGVAANVTFAVDGVPPFTGATEEQLSGRIVLAPDVDHVERAFDDWKYGRISERPFLEVTIPTLSDPTLAPEGTHLLSVRVQYVPRRLRDGEWDEAARDRVAALTLAMLEEHAPGLADRVGARRVLTPEDLERDFGLTGGHPMHGEHALDQFFAWRPLLGHARYRLAGIHGLYLCGSGAHPGGGVTGGPGANAARAILADARRRRRPR